ncbi:hypothetical protein THIOKS1500003 [Thiocapsa sp. KS1]|nr:hypothetical protein THIOKS1500003 [Thiocapsa sp. KS1]
MEASGSRSLTRRSPHGSAGGVLNTLLNVLFEVAYTGLDLADVLLDIAFDFQLLVSGHVAGDFLHLTFRFFVTAFDLVFVHDVILVGG